MTTERVRRVNEVMRQILSESLQQLSDPALQMVTITAVDCTRDFEHATVFVQVSGNETRRVKALAGLERAKGALQGRVGREISMRRTPHLRFSFDESYEAGTRINEILAADPPLAEPIELPTDE